MRLSKLKLAGFKSFVDPTILSFPTNLVGIVGPNGCGKSNVIDAVRWVMGEISAKNLRGGAMADVIFNGSANRKPVEEASVEMVFAEADLPQYPEHSEIAVKREISRDGQSTYFLNGIKCRRKDITDLFLGTGLGSRSYAIIEQGMISRFIEAKPDDLRIFLEEAAGISKYKERRKESEQKMKQTRDNLARLDEIRNELDRQLEKLRKQAREAEKYRELKESERLLKAQLLALRWYTLDTSVQEQQQYIDEQAVILQQDLLALQELETTYKQQREAQIQAQALLEAAQEHYYEFSGEVKRLEQTIEHASERQEQLESDLQQVEDTIAETETQIATDQQQLAELVTATQATEAELVAAQEAELFAIQGLEEAETQWQEWQTQWDDFTQRTYEPSQQAQVERTRAENLEQRIFRNQQRLERIEQEQSTLDISALQDKVALLTDEIAQATELLTVAEAELQVHQEAILTLRDSTQQLAAQLHDNRSRAQQLSGRLASLEALQESALGKSNADLDAWLHVQGLRDKPRLAQALIVESGWERAVEVVLDDALQALCVADLAGLQEALKQPPQGKLVLFEAPRLDEVCENFPSVHHLEEKVFTPPLEKGGWGDLKSLGIEESQIPPSPPFSKGRRDLALPLEKGRIGDFLVALLEKVQAPWSLISLLDGIWAVDSLEAAYQLRSRLTVNESVITPQGIWLGMDWIHSHQGSDEQAGVLAREQEINRLAAQLRTLDETAVKMGGELEQQRLTLREHEELRLQRQQEVNTVRQQLAQLQSHYSGQQARLEHTELQAQRLADEQTELETQMTQDASDLKAGQKRLHCALATMEQLAEEREKLAGQRDLFQEMVLQTRQARQETQNQRHQVEIRLESLRTAVARLQPAIARATTRLQQLQEQRDELQHSLAKHTENANYHSDLEDYQQQLSKAEEAVFQAKQTVQHLTSALSEYENQRHLLEDRSDQLRSALEQARMDAQGNQVRRQTFEEQLAEMELSPVALLAELPDAAEETAWQTQLETVERKLQRLGSVNLAALAEYEEQSTRKKYLDSQAEDLNNALNLLDDAIRTIDREIRQRFRHTVETINISLQTMFPRLFGGGQARLELTSDDILTAGVSIMARPPGKRNSSIHLLSGGEKALTAIALVFAIFELNPAPFCMLDEVDAPLDDTNVGRFSSLVKAMSERVQFIFISHNKITMEIADQLTGITMQEAGVSRPVTVDISLALKMVAV